MNHVTTPPIYDEVYKFLISAPTLEQLLAFRPSPALQARISELLDASRDNRLTPDERRELDEIERANHFVRMLKVYAEVELAKKS